MQYYALPTADGDIKYVGVVGGRYQFARDDPVESAEDMIVALDDYPIFNGDYLLR